MRIDGSTSDPLIDHCLPIEGVYGLEGGRRLVELVHTDAWNAESWDCFVEQEFLIFSCVKLVSSIE